MSTQAPVASLITPLPIDRNFKMKLKSFYLTPHILRSSSLTWITVTSLISFLPFLFSSKPLSLTQWSQGFVEKPILNHSYGDCSVTSHHVHKKTDANFSPIGCLEDWIKKKPHWGLCLWLQYSEDWGKRGSQGNKGLGGIFNSPRVNSKFF